LFVGEEHQQRQGTPKKARCSLEYVMSLFIQFVHLLYSFILFILLFQLACPPLSARLLVKNTNKGEGICYVFVHSICSSVILFHLVCWCEEHQQRRLNFFIRYPISSCLLVKNTNKGEEENTNKGEGLRCEGGGVLIPVRWFLPSKSNGQNQG
jgi:hypothetical protein